MESFINELNLHGVHFDWRRVSDQLADYERDLEEALRVLNQNLVVPLQHEDMRNENLAKALYLNCIYPRSI